MIEIESIRESGGWLKRYTHESTACQCEMTFSVYLPPAAENNKVPAVYFLSGLTCTDDNVRTKAGAQRYAAELGIALIMPDTSPRGDNVPDDADRYDLGKGAGFYVNATNGDWAKNFQMYDYVTRELPELLEANLPLTDKRSVTGHSMGGHGALIAALKNPDRYASVSAFSPICHPVKCGWGQGCFSEYIGENLDDWKLYDATELVLAGALVPEILIDQGGDDEFPAEQLYPEDLKAACDDAGIELTLRMQDHYDHSYHFISSFIGEHLAFHAKALKA